MFYPVNVTGLARRGTLGAFAGDPTLPYSPGRVERLMRIVRGTVAWREAMPACSEACPAEPAVRAG